MAFFFWKQPRNSPDNHDSVLCMGDCHCMATSSACVYKEWLITLVHCNVLVSWWRFVYLRWRLIQLLLVVNRTRKLCLGPLLCVTCVVIYVEIMWLQFFFFLGLSILFFWVGLPSQFLLVLSMFSLVSGGTCGLQVSGSCCNPFPCL